MFAGAAPFLLSFGFGGYWVLKGQLTPGELIAFINLLNPLAGPVSQLPRLLGNFRAQMEAANRVMEIIELEPERQGGEYSEGKDSDISIAFNNVKFAYKEDGEEVLKGVNFDIKKGEQVAVVGMSGAGKSTLIKLLQGGYEDYEGNITVLGHEISEWDLNAMREHMSLVSQDTYLFPGTLEENLSYGNLDSDDEEVVSAAKAANAHDFITELRDGYGTNAGEFGDRLSGGQKQRISIARAMLKKSPILLLDEATSALDTHSEFKVQKALDQLMAGKTALVIAHRLSTIKNVDRIIVMEEGQIAEAGTHDELLARDGIYKSLYLRQLAQDEQPEEVVV